MIPAGPGALSLDDEVLLPLLERVSRDTITVKEDGYRRAWYHDAGRQCLFATYLLDKLTEWDYLRWDGYVGEVGHLIARKDGVWAGQAG